MKHGDISAIMRGLAPVVRDFVAETVAPIVTRLEGLERRFDAMPIPRDGKDADMVVLLAEVRSAADAITAKVPETVAAEVVKAMEAIPAPEKGAKGDPGKDGADGQPGKEGQPGPAGKDGTGITGTVVDQGGVLILTLSDGSQKQAGVVVGKDGAPGQPGKDGRDGLGFEDMTEELAEDGRTIVRRYARGDEVKEYRHQFAVVLDRGVWQPGEYAKGDGVTWGGSFWIAQEATSEKPDSGTKAWRLAVKRGKDGKDAVKP